MDLGDLKFLEAPAKVLKLSEAVRIGSMYRPKSRGPTDSAGGSCALMAAAEATGLAYADWRQVLTHLRKRFPNVPHRVLQEAYYKNDNTDCTREEIADWLSRNGY